MATADHLKMLIKAHFNDKDEQFRTAVLQIAAYEAQQGHPKLARELKTYLEKASKPKCNVINLNSSSELIVYTPTNHHINDLVVSEELHERIDRILQEFRQREKLQRYGLANRRNIFCNCFQCSPLLFLKFYKKVKMCLGFINALVIFLRL